MSDMKCQHEWYYFDEHDFPNGYEYEQVNIPHKRCKKCGREYELFDGYGEYAKRWRKVEYWSPELHKLEQELMHTRKALDIALCSLQDIAESDGDFITGASTPLDEHEYADMMLKEIKRQMKTKTALEQKEE